MWVFIFVFVSVLMFLPFLQGKDLWQSIILWVLQIPLTLILAKWYFMKVTPSVKSGLWLGVVWLLTGTVLDLLITVPLFVKSFSLYYGNWQLWVGYALVFLLCVYAGGEYDVAVWEKK